MVDRLNDPELRSTAADWLDWLLVPVPGQQIRMARYPVTNGQYRRFIEAGGYGEQRWWSREGWQWRAGKPRYNHQKMDRPDFWDDSKWNGSTHPVVGVSWYEAEAYCNWLTEYVNKRMGENTNLRMNESVDGEEDKNSSLVTRHSSFVFRLPTESEWEQAATGGDGREYPWGNGWRDGVCNTSEAGIGRTTPVGQFSPAGDSPTGCADMAGNVWEWCADWYDKQGNLRVVRGGSWVDLQVNARCAFRDRLDPYVSDYDLGFRVVSPIFGSES